jgi:hypothetical protein
MLNVIYYILENNNFVTQWSWTLFIVKMYTRNLFLDGKRK